MSRVGRVCPNRHMYSRALPGQVKFHAQIRRFVIDSHQVRGLKHSVRLEYFFFECKMRFTARPCAEFADHSPLCVYYQLIKYHEKNYCTRGFTQRS